MTFIRRIGTGCNSYRKQTTLPKLKSFPDTPWTIVLNTREPDSQLRLNALEELCRAYWPAIYSFARLKGHTPADAEDLTQAFFTDLVHKNRLHQLAPQSGRFRSWLIRCFENHLIDAHRESNAQKRGGGWVRIEISSEAGEIWFNQLSAAASEASADSVQDKIWALAIIKRALQALEADCKQRGKSDLFEKLRPFLDVEAATGAYAGVSAELGMSENTIRVTVHRLRERYTDFMEAEIAKIVETPEQIAEEFAALRMALL